MIRVLVVPAGLVLLCSSGTMWAQEPLARGPDGAELGTVKLRAGQVGAFRVPGAS